MPMASIASQMPTASVTIMTNDMPATTTQSLTAARTYIFTFTSFICSLKCSCVTSLQSRRSRGVDTNLFCGWWLAKFYLEATIIDTIHVINVFLRFFIQVTFLTFFLFFPRFFI